MHTRAPGLLITGYSVSNKNIFQLSPVWRLVLFQVGRINDNKYALVKDARAFIYIYIFSRPIT